MDNPNEDEKNEFVETYMKTNRGKTKTDALQEWNRKVAKEYIDGFKGNISLSNLPVVLRREILRKTPGGRYSVLTAKQGNDSNRVEISRAELCPSPIGVKEFKSYVLNRTEEFLRTGRKVDIKFIAVYRFVVGYEEVLVHRYPEAYRELIKLSQEYIGDKRFPVVSNISINKGIDDEMPEGGDIEDYCIFYLTNMAISVFTDRRIKRDIGLRRLYKQDIDENNHLYNLPSYFGEYDFGTTRNKLLSIMKEKLDSIKFEDAPNVIVDYNTAREILKLRKGCTFTEELFNKVYNQEEIARSILLPLAPTVRADMKVHVLTELDITIDMDDIMDNYDRGEYGNKGEYEYDDRIVVIFNRYM